MNAYFTVDVLQGGHWHQMNLVQSRSAADALYKKYTDDDGYDTVAIHLHTSSSCVVLKISCEEEELPW